MSIPRPIIVYWLPSQRSHFSELSCVWILLSLNTSFDISGKGPLMEAMATAPIPHHQSFILMHLAWKCHIRLEKGKKLVCLILGGLFTQVWLSVFSQQVTLSKLFSYGNPFILKPLFSKAGYSKLTTVCDNMLCTDGKRQFSECQYYATCAGRDRFPFAN